MTDPTPNLRNEAVDFMYKHGDLTFSAAYAAVDKLCGNGFYITRTPTPDPRDAEKRRLINTMTGGILDMPKAVEPVEVAK